MARKRARFRALVLSAGLGSRLRPLTHSLAKPLLPVGLETVAGRTLRRLADAGCEGALLNLHHLSDSVRSHFGRSYFGLPLEYTYEQEIQGTFGALYPARRFLRDAEVVVLVNGDSVCHWPIEAMIDHHLRSGAEATLLLLRQSPNEALGGGIGVDGRGKVVRFRDYPARGTVERQHVFAGCHLISPRLLDRAEEGFADIIEALYQPLLEEGGRVESVTTGRSWHDLGTPDRYLKASIAEAKGSWWSRFWPGSRKKTRSDLAEMHPGVEQVRSFVARGAQVGEGVRLEDSLVLEGASIGAGCQLRRCIIGPGVRLETASGLENRLICRLDKKHEIGKNESVMGELVYTPIRDTDSR